MPKKGRGLLFKGYFFFGWFQGKQQTNTHFERFRILTHTPVLQAREHDLASIWFKLNLRNVGPFAHGGEEQPSLIYRNLPRLCG